jgi:uncharacterized membrane protein
MKLESVKIKCLLCWVTAALFKVDSSYFVLEIFKPYLTYISFYFGYRVVVVVVVVVIQLFIYLFIYELTQQPKDQLWSNREQGNRQNKHTQTKVQFLKYDQEKQFWFQSASSTRAIFARRADVEHRNMTTTTTTTTTLII